MDNWKNSTRARCVQNVPVKSKTDREVKMVEFRKAPSRFIGMT
jgi:hypothetical protein